VLISRDEANFYRDANRLVGALLDVPDAQVGSLGLTPSLKVLAQIYAAADCLISRMEEWTGWPQIKGALSPALSAIAHAAQLFESARIARGFCRSSGAIKVANYSDAQRLESALASLFDTHDKVVAFFGFEKNPDPNGWPFRSIKPGPRNELEKIVASVDRNRKYLSIVRSSLVWAAVEHTPRFVKKVLADSRRQGRPKRKRRRLSERALTPRQKQAGELWEQHHKVQLVANAMGLTRQTAQQHLEQYWKLNPESKPKLKRRHKTQALPTDDRGQATDRFRR
jgi:DNA-binding CsgD family transcriptional regulator